MPRVALQNSPGREPCAAQRAVALDRFRRVRRARRIEAAVRSEERTQEQPITFDKDEQDALHAGQYTIRAAWPLVSCRRLSHTKDI